MLRSSGDELGERGEESFDPRPGHLEELARDDGYRVKVGVAREDGRGEEKAREGKG